LKNPDCNEALKRLIGKIDMEKIKEEIDEMPIISDIRKEFYKVMLEKRFKEILEKSYKKLKKKQQSV